MAMEGNFVADVRIDDSDEVLQLPIVKHKLKSLLGKAVKKIALQGAPIIPSSDDTLEEFLNATGKFFGKDPSKWESVGEPKVEITEEDGKRYVKNTGTFTGTELHLFVEQPYFDERLPIRDDKPELNFNQRQIEVITNEEWAECIGDQPWSLSIRRQVLMVYLHAKLEADDGDLALEGCHGFWEMSINKDHHLDILMDRTAALLTKLSSNNIQVATLAAAAVWGLSTSGTSRRNLADLDVTTMLVSSLKRSLKLTVVGADVPDVPIGQCRDSQRAMMQRNLLGGLAVLLIDRCCRRPYLTLEPDFSTFFLLVKNLSGYAPVDAQARRETSAKVLTSLIQRDADARRSLIQSGSLKSVLNNINPEGPGDSMIQFCMASLLATLVLDDQVMDLIRERGEAPILFEACILLLSSTLGKLREELDRQLGSYYQTEDEPPLYDLALGVRLAEASSQAMWGSAHACVMMNPIQMKMQHVEMLGKMGLDCWTNDQLPLARVCHCVTATLATLASVQDTADLIMACPGNGVLTTLITLLEVFDTEIFDRAGHVKAAACAGVAFLTCHPIGAKGDECMNGPYRAKLLECGAFGALLRAALTSVNNEECDLIVQQAAAIALMYLSTTAGSIEAGELAMYSALLMDSDNSEMIEFLMAGMWILLRNPDNRHVLGSAFQKNPASKKGGPAGMAGKLQDAIQVHDVNEQADAIRKTMTWPAPGLVPSEESSKLPDPEAAPAPLEVELPVQKAPPPDEEVAPAGSDEVAKGAPGPAPDAASAEGGVDGTADGTHEPCPAAGEAPPGEGADEDEAAPASTEPPVREGEGEGEGEPGTPAAAASDRSSPSVDLEAQHVEEASEDDLLKGQGPRLNNNVMGAAGMMQKGIPTGLEDEEAAQVPGSAGSSASRASKACKAKEEADALAKEVGKDERLDKQLGDNWGLETLVTVGESWLPAMIQQDEDGDTTDVPVLKLFEFLVASICLFMIEDKPDPERRALDLFRMGAPAGTQKSGHTWWTVDAHAPEASADVDDQIERALNILVRIIGMRLNAAWKSIQLGTLTIWNACSRNPSIERNVVEKGLCFRLVDIINTATWPPSLRDTAGGLLEFMAERYSNLQFFPLMGLPEDIDWPYDTPPPPGMVPTLAAHINLINSRIPILEYRGCHAVARMCFAAPYRSSNSKNFVRDAKAVSAVLGAVDAIIGLIKRVNKRYEDVLSGQIARLKQIAKDAVPEGEEDPSQYEKDMTSAEATQDVYFVLFAALLNISVLRSVQPMVARKGLMVLLGTNTYLYNRVLAAAERGQDVGGEEKLLHLCSSIIQNISLHPQNRTRLYKAELKGSTALEKLIEDAMATDDDHSTFFNGPYELPPVSPKGSPRGSGPSTLRKPVNHLSRSAQGPLKKKAANGKSSHTAPLSPNKWSRHAGVLNTSVDSLMPKTVNSRPKVMFPPIVEKKEPVWNIGDRNLQMAPAQSSLARLAQSKSKTPLNQSRESNRSGTPDSNADDGELDSPRPDVADTMAPVDSRHRFLHWLDSTFQAGEEAGQGHSGMGGGESKKTVRKKLWDENGDWLDNEPETSKTLNRLLCKPLNQMWKEAPEVRARHGQARWEPVVSEYREATPQADHPFTRSAAKLLTTQLPKSQDTLMVAATQMMATGTFDEIAANQFSADRPETRDRNHGRMGLTVLKPNADIVLQAQMAAQAKMEADEQAASMGHRRPIQDDEPLVPIPVAPVPTVPLKVCIGPQRPRQVMSFEERIMLNDDATQPMLTVFEHVEGSRVCQGMFPSYQLPNGKQTFMYYRGGTLLDEVHVDAVQPPPRPTTVPEALQQSMPLADVLALIAKPPGSAPPFIPYKPVPYLVPLPSRHTIQIKRPDMMTANAFGDIREDNVQLMIVAEKIIKNQTNTRVEAIEFIPVEEREPWTLPTSIFKLRAKESDCKAFHDLDATEMKMFERDWQRATSKEKFTSMMSREHKQSKDTNGMDDKAMLQAVHDVLLHNYQLWYSSFLYYGAGSSGSLYHMSLNSFTSFLDECQIADAESQFIKRSDCDTVFIVCNFQPDKKSAEAQVNFENAMMRYEFLEALVRMAIAKYGRGQATEELDQAVKMLLENNLLANLPAHATLNTNNFRKDRLYNEEVDLVFKKHNAMLKALYSRYRLKPPGGGLRTKTLKSEGWQQMMGDASLVDSQFTLMDANLAFLWCRMLVIDEIKDYAKYTSLSFVDFLEAIARVADMKSLPSDSELHDAGYNHILEWALEKERMEGVTGDGLASAAAADMYSGEGESTKAHNMDIFRVRESAGVLKPKPRPLYVKLEILLDLIFRRLFRDPGDPSADFNYDGLLKLVKKIDKDLGP